MCVLDCCKTTLPFSKGKKAHTRRSPKHHQTKRGTSVHLLSAWGWPCVQETAVLLWDYRGPQISHCQGADASTTRPFALPVRQTHLNRNNPLQPISSSTFRLLQINWNLKMKWYAFDIETETREILYKTENDVLIYLLALDTIQKPYNVLHPRNTKEMFSRMFRLLFCTPSKRIANPIGKLHKKTNE